MTTVEFVVQVVAAFIAGHLWATAYPKKPTTPPAPVVEGIEHRLNALTDKLNEVEASVEAVDGKVNELASSTTEALDTLLQQKR